MPSFSYVSRRLLLIVVLAAAALPLVTGSASASESCDALTSQPFAPWLDYAHYALAPNGSFDDGEAAWQLSGPASVEDGSLRLRPGSSALSSPVCISLAHPTIRFFADGGLLSSLAVSVVLSDDGGVIDELPMGAALLSPSWQPTLPMPVLVNLVAPLQPQGQLRARFRFTPVLGSMRMDDVWVDPWKTT